MLTMRIVYSILFFNFYKLITSREFSIDSLRLLKSHTVYPEVFMNSTQLIQYNGYQAEKHEVTTKDGFILGVHRIPKPSRPVVLLQHGLLADSGCYLFNAKNGSLAFILSDAGYDVWLGNSRGNTYSMKHAKYNSSQDEFWNFSWQDMADKDLPATIDYILKSTNQSDLIYIGHSQGTCIGFDGFSRNKEMSKKIKLFIALAPVGKVKNIRGLLSLAFKAFKDDLDRAYTVFGRKGFLLNSSTNMDIADKICDTVDTALVCSDFTELIYGRGLTDVDVNRIPVYLAHIPSGTSVRNIVHFAQEILSGQYQLYDFGSPGANMAQYNQTTPPQVNLQDVDVPVALYSGSNDFLADPIDVKFMSSQLKNVVDQKEYFNWNHKDFIVGNTPPRTLYIEILKLIDKFV